MGMEWLVSWIHKKGFQFGIYEDIGNKTCGGFPGIEGHFKVDAATFASWGVDMVKLDGCYEKTSNMATDYPRFGHDLNSTGRPMVYSCSWPAYLKFADVPWDMVKKNCNMWRLYDDIQDSWDSMIGIANFWGDNQAVLAPLAGPGSWNDPDQLIIGDFSLSHNEQEVQMALWCIFSAPLLISADIHYMKESARNILLNEEAIAVNQDVAGVQGLRLSSWFKTLHDGDVAVACVSERTDDIPYPIAVEFTEVGFASGTKVAVRNIFARQDEGTFTNGYTANVFSHSTVFLRLTVKKQ
jgi:hypothetical protein